MLPDHTIRNEFCITAQQQHAPYTSVFILASVLFLIKLRIMANTVVGERQAKLHVAILFVWFSDL